mgnify:CR=1 FL=1
MHVYYTFISEYMLLFVRCAFFKLKIKLPIKRRDRDSFSKYSLCKEYRYFNIDVTAVTDKVLPKKGTRINNKIIAVNSALTLQTGYSEAELIGEDPKILSSSKCPKSIYQDIS